MLEEKKCSFTRLVFHLLSDGLSGMPRTWGPDADFACENLMRTFPWTSNPVLRARESEAERKRPSPAVAPGHPHLHARTHPLQPVVLKPGEVGTPWVHLHC